VVSRSPSFQFYPGDWLNDIAVRASSPPARALWIDMLCAMHQGEPYGYLTLKGKPFTSGQLSKLAGFSIKNTHKYLKELAENGVFSTTENGLIYSKRMVSDEEKRRAWAERQQRSRNGHADVTPDVTRESRPSSSLSSSSSSPLTTSKKKGQKENDAPDFFQNLKQHVADEWQKKKNAPYTFRPTEDGLLKALCNAHTVWGTMALWDVYLESKDDFARRNGYNITEFFRQVPRLVDDPDWKKRAREHEKKLYPPLDSLVGVHMNGKEPAQ
jgi:hypothetical protein